MIEIGENLALVLIMGIVALVVMIIAIAKYCRDVKVARYTREDEDLTEIFQAFIEGK